ncbi:unnamed protein product, partial [Nezara viridula]
NTYNHSQNQTNEILSINVINFRPVRGRIRTNYRKAHGYQPQEIKWSYPRPDVNLVKISDQLFLPRGSLERREGRAVSIMGSSRYRADSHANISTRPFHAVKCNEALRPVLPTALHLIWTGCTKYGCQEVDEHRLPLEALSPETKQWLTEDPLFPESASSLLGGPRATASLHLYGAQLCGACRHVRDRFAPSCYNSFSSGVQGMY